MTQYQRVSVDDAIIHGMIGQLRMIYAGICTLLNINIVFDAFGQHRLTFLDDHDNPIDSVWLDHQSQNYSIALHNPQTRQMFYVTFINVYGIPYFYWIPEYSNLKPRSDGGWMVIRNNIVQEVHYQNRKLGLKHFSMDINSMHSVRCVFYHIECEKIRKAIAVPNPPQHPQHTQHPQPYQQPYQQPYNQPYQQLPQFRVPHSHQSYQPPNPLFAHGMN